MAYVINSKLCILCGTCAVDCPRCAIAEVEEKYVIDAAACAACGTCAKVCPLRGASEPAISVLDTVSS